MTCVTKLYSRHTRVKNQKECQQKCVQDFKCTGIVYSHKTRYRRDCFICADDKMESSINNFGFYRLSGNVEVYAFKLYIVDQMI